LNIDRINELIDEGYEKMLVDFVYAHNPDGTPHVAFVNDCRFADRRKVKWVGIIHETQFGDPKMTRLTKDVAYLEHWQNRDTDRTKYLSGLAWACYVEPGNDRNSHYFARELMYRGYHRSAIKEFERHIAMDKWADERMQSMVYMGNCHEVLGEGERAMECWDKAILISGDRREPYIRLAQYWKAHNSPIRVAAFAAAALQIPNNGFYGNLVQNYTYGPHELMYWAKGWLGDIPAARQHLLKCLEYHPTEQRFINDMKYYFSAGEMEEAQKNARWKNYPDHKGLIDLRDKIPVPEGLRVLNVGVGPGTSSLSMQLPYFKFKQLDHIDINKEYLDKAKETKWAAEQVNFIHDDVRNLSEKLDNYDLILLFDLIEHLPREDAKKILVSRPAKLVFFPVEKEIGECTRKEDPADVLSPHVSYWSEQDLIDLGYKTEFIDGFHRNYRGWNTPACWAYKPAVFMGDYKDGPTVSVLMAAYNAEAYIRQAIESCQAQTLKDWELIIVDDGSTDNTLGIALEYEAHDSRIKIVTHGINRNYSVAVNTALSVATGRYIARLDADDWDDPTRLEKSVARLESTPVCDCVSCGMFVGPAGKMEHYALDSKGMVPEVYMRPDGSGASPIDATIVAKREVYQIVGGFDPEIVVGGDADWNIRANLKGIRWAYIPEDLYYYRSHANQTVRLMPWKEHSDKQAARLNAAWPAWSNPFNPNRHIEILVTGACDRKCKHCSQAAYNEDFKTYQTPLELVDKVCRRSIENGARYEWLQFSGGEPLLWDNLEAACKLAKDSGAFSRVRVFTNGEQSKRLYAALDAGLIDCAYLDTYNANPKAMETLKEKYAGRFVLDPTVHKPLPVSPFSGVIPARCNCDHLCVIENNVYPCGNFYTHIKRLGLEFKNYKFCSLDDDWIEFYRKVDRFNMDICSYCLANGKVWDKIPCV
jgi:glycosyltransferase involved in cell wall biosynthesis/tetratricopeptide (TPR) repeat protein